MNHAAPLLFNNLPSEPVNKNPMVGINGILDGVTKCKKCKFLIRDKHHGKTYSKCEYRGVTRGAGTDHSMYWDACKGFKTT